MILKYIRLQGNNKVHKVETPRNPKSSHGASISAKKLKIKNNNNRLIKEAQTKLESLDTVDTYLWELSSISLSTKAELEELSSFFRKPNSSKLKTEQYGRI